MNTCKIVAEAGCNHAGNIDTAIDMITLAAKFCNVYAIKFQKRTVKKMLSKSEYNKPHPNPRNAYGKTYGEHREYLEFNIDQHAFLKKQCEAAGIVYSSSVWDVQAAHEIIDLNPAMIKVPSACNQDRDLLELLCAEYGGEIHISLGMTTNAEREAIVLFLERHDRLKDVVLYACTSGYPVQFEDAAVVEVAILEGVYGRKVKAIGYSGHHLGIAVDIAAVCLGAEWLERHYTLDRTLKGTDHAASLEPDGLRRLARDVIAVDKAMQIKENGMLQAETEQREKLKKVRTL